jgi:hypothetical protein
MINDMKLKMKNLLASAILIVVAFTHMPVHACTAFMMSDGKSVLVGNNEDYNIPYTRVWFVPAEKGQYGRIYFGYDNWSPQGGMNDQGLFFDFFATKPLEVKLSKDKPNFNGPIIDTMAARCATVEEVLDMFGQYNLEFMSKFQMFVVDKSGDAAIIEGDDIIRKMGSFQVVTNFYQSKVEENRRPCEWYKPSCMQYQKAESMLKEGGTASVALFRDILEAAHRNTLFVRTQYSNIYDLKNGVVYLYYLHNFDNEVVIDLSAELKKGRHYYALPSLFGKELKYGRKVYTHPSPAFSISYPKHYKVTAPVRDEVLLVKYPISNTPQLGVYVDNKPKDIELQNIGQRYFAKRIKKHSTYMKMVSSAPNVLSDGTIVNEVLFDRVVNNHWPLKTMVVSTYRGDKLIFAGVSSFAHPETFREFLYSLRFD